MVLMDDDSFVRAKGCLHPLNSTDCLEENPAPDLSQGVGYLPPDCTDFNFGFTATGMTGLGLIRGDGEDRRQWGRSTGRILLRRAQVMARRQPQTREDKERRHEEG